MNSQSQFYQIVPNQARYYIFWPQESASRTVNQSEVMIWTRRMA
jgi:hypothetical protein